MRFSVGGLTHWIASHAMIGGSSGDAMGIVGDASDHAWECLLAGPDINTVKGPSTAVKWPFTAECLDRPSAAHGEDGSKRRRMEVDNSSFPHKMANVQKMFAQESHP